MILFYPKLDFFATINQTGSPGHGKSSAKNGFFPRKTHLKFLMNGIMDLLKFILTLQSEKTGIFHPEIS